MQYELTQEEKFNDRLELIGFATSAISAILLVVYFGMLFFSAKAYYQSLWEKVGLITLFASTLSLGFFIPTHKKFARHLLSLIYFSCLVISYYYGWEKSSWPLILSWFYCLFAGWVLIHPESIRFFRALKPFEQKQLMAADWLTLHRLFLGFFSVKLILDGLVKLSENGQEYHYDPDTGLLLTFLGISLLVVLQFFRRLFPWARWVLAVFALTLGILTLPETIDRSIKNYLEYWLVLAKTLYFISLVLYLAFSPKVKQAFSQPPVKPKSSPAPAPLP